MWQTDAWNTNSGVIDQVMVDNWCRAPVMAPAVGDVIGTLPLHESCVRV